MSGLEARQRSNPGPVSPLHDLRTRYIELRARYGDLLWSEPDGAELGVALAGQPADSYAETFERVVGPRSHRR